MLKRRDKYLVFILLVCVLGIAYVGAYRTSEPFFNNDETRHVMTGVYFRDLLSDLPLGDLRDYTINYYLQYPALGLLVWPPFFYFVEGVAMSIFGTSLVVPKTLVCLFALMACAYLFLLVCRSHDTARAAVAVLLFGLSPLVFTLSHYVMLEVPTLALALAAAYHFVSYMDKERRRDLLLAALFSALAALTRFDAVYLLPLFLLLVAGRKRWKILWRREVWAAAAVALLVVAPFYALSTNGIGWMHFKFLTEPLSPSDPGFLSLRRFFFYPSLLPAQVGWPALVPALVGIVYAVRAAQRERAGIYLAMIAATYLTFTPMGELGVRHTIYWVPAFALFSADGVARVAAGLRTPQFYLPLAACVLMGVLWVTLGKPLPTVRGYEEAARAVVATNSTGSPFCLFVGGLNGNFIYQLRRQDPRRQLWVLRADKLFFSVLEMPGMQYRQLASSDEDILATIFRYDPEFIVVEEPPPPQIDREAQGEQLRSEFERQLREVISNHPERFGLEKIVAVESNDPQFQGLMLKVFRNQFRNEHPEKRLELDILMLRRSLQTSLP